MKKFCLILVFLLSVTSFVKASEIKADPTLVPTLVVVSFDGKNFDLKEKRGKVVIINFWAKWCADCRKEMLILDEIYREYQSRNVEIIGINIGSKRERQKALEVSSSLSYQNAMFVDIKQTNFEQPNTIPMTYVIDKNGKIAAQITEATKLTKQDFDSILSDLLK